MEARSLSFSWSTPEVGYFIPDNDFQHHGLKHMETGKDLIPRFYNVHAFVNHLRALLVFKHESVVRANIHSCLRDDALDWYDTELTDSERIQLSILPLEQGWFKGLLQRFKLSYEISLFRLETARFGDENGPSGCQSARNLLRHAQALGIEDRKSQLTRLWERLQKWSATGGKVPKPRSSTLTSDFMRTIDMLEQARMYEHHEADEHFEGRVYDSESVEDSESGGFGDWWEWWNSKLKKFNRGEEMNPELVKFLESRKARSS